MAGSHYTFVLSRQQQFQSHLGTSIAQISGHVAVMGIEVSPLAAFVAVAMHLGTEGPQKLGSYAQMYKPSYAYLAYVFERLQMGSAADILPQLLTQYSNHILSDLAMLKDRWQESRTPPFVGSADDLTYTAIASSFGVALMLVNEEKQTYSLPLYCQEMPEQYPLLPLMVYGGWSLVFSAIEMPKTNVMSLLKEYEKAQKLLEFDHLSEESHQVLTSLISRIDAENQNAVAPNLDSVASSLWHQMDVFKSWLLCSMCTTQPGSQLSCNHRICAQCVFAGGAWTVGESVLSPCCSQQVTMAEIHTLLGNTEFHAKLEAIKSFSYVVCISCGRLSEQEQVNTLSCSHSTCFICVLSAVQTNTALCPLCRVYPDDSHLALISSQPVKCSMCAKDKLITNFPKFRCADHTVCFDCFDVMDVCAGCSRQLTDTEKQLISRSFFQCQACEQHKNRKLLFKGGVCGCRVCTDCFHDFVKINRTITRCFLCKTRYPESTLDAHFRLFKAMLPDLIHQELGEVRRVRAIKAAKCCVCDVTDKADKVQLPCEHVLHCYCLSHRLADKAIKGEPAECPLCRNEIDTTALQPLDAALYPAQRKCPKTGCGSAATKVDANTYKCEAEGTQYCSKCHEIRETEHPVDTCLQKSRTFVINLLLKVGYKNCSKEIRQCPECLLPHMLKKQSSDSFFCVACKASYCTGCLAPCEPIRLHGDLWHRRTCTLARAWKQEDAEKVLGQVQMSPDCRKCREAGKRCEPPN